MSISEVNKFGNPGPSKTKKILNGLDENRIVDINLVNNGGPKTIDVFGDLPFNGFNGKIYVEFFRSIASWGSGAAATTQPAQLTFRYASGPSVIIEKYFSAGVSNDCFKYGGLIDSGVLVPPYSETGYKMIEIVVNPLDTIIQNSEVVCGKSITTGRLYF